MKSTPLIYVIVVTYKGQRWYERCFSSLRTSNLPVKTIVIDNASNDGSVSYLQEHFPELEIIESSENLGFAKANNIGIRKAYDNGADYIFLLNQDAWVEPKTLSKLVNVFEQYSDAGIVSPIHLNGNGDALDTFFAQSLSTQFSSDCFLGKISHVYEADFINAAAWLLSRKTIETVGGFDTLLFKHYGEDNNYAQRIHYWKLKTYVCTETYIYHDRAKRSSNYINENQFSQHNLYRNIRMNLGNICMKIDETSILNKIRKECFRHLIHFRFSEANKCKQSKHVILEIFESRRINTKKGLNWL